MLLRRCPTVDCILFCTKRRYAALISQHEVNKQTVRSRRVAVAVHMALAVVDGVVVLVVVVVMKPREQLKLGCLCL